MSTEMRHKFFYDYSIKIYAIANICVLAGEKKKRRARQEIGNNTRGGEAFLNKCFVDGSFTGN